MMKFKVNYLLFLISFLLGYLLVLQFYSTKEVKKFTRPEEMTPVSLEVAELIKTNRKLRTQTEELSQSLEKLKRTGLDRDQLSGSLTQELDYYKIILGKTAVSGPGVEITFSQPLDQTQIIDLINALKNIGAEAIAIGGERITPKTSIAKNSFTFPYTIQALGNPQLLKEALIRRGGIIEQIKIPAPVIQKEKLVLPPA